MNSTAKTFLTALIAVASAATMALLLAEQTVPQNLHTTVVQLEPVLVVGQRTAISEPVTQLPRVVVAGKRRAATPEQHVALSCTPERLC